MWSLVDQAILPLSDPESPVAMLSPGTPPRHPPLFFHAHLRWTSAPHRRLVAAPRCPPPREAIPPPSLSSLTPEHPALLLSQLLARHQGRPVGILLHLGNCEIKYPRNRGRRERRGRGEDEDRDKRQAPSLRLPSTAFRAAQTRKRTCHIRTSWISLLGPLTASHRHWLPTVWTGHHSVGMLWVWSLAALSAGKDALIVQTHHHAGHPPPGRPPESWRFCPTGPWAMEVRAVPCLFPGSVCCFSVLSTSLVAPHPECLHGLFPAVSGDRSSFFSCHLVREAPGQTDRPEEIQLTPSINNTDRPVDLD